MIIASHYVVKDLLLIMKSGDAEEIRKSCAMFSGRYKDDKELVSLCNQALGIIEKKKKFKEDKDFKDIESKFEELERTRVTADGSSSGLWYSDRRKE